MGKYDAQRRYAAKTYKTCEVNLSIKDHATLKQFAMAHKLGMSGIMYRATIEYMRKNYGVRLEGTPTMRAHKG